MDKDKTNYLALSLAVFLGAFFISNAFHGYSLGLSESVSAQVISTTNDSSSGGAGGGGSAVETTETKWCFDFRRNLRIGDSGNEVLALQYALSLELGNIVFEDAGAYEEETASAVSEFQEKYKNEVLTPSRLRFGTGFFGISTRAKLNRIFGCAKPKYHQPNYDASPTTIIRGETYEFTAKISWARPESNIVFFLQRPDGSFKYSDQAAGGESQDILYKSADRRSNARGNFTLSVRQKITEEGQNGIWTSWVTVGGIPSNKVYHRVMSRDTVNQSSITVLSPNGGESWQIGQIYEISWYQSQATEISLAIKNSNLPRTGDAVFFIRNIADIQGVAGKNTFKWTVPSDLRINGNYKIFAGGYFNSGFERPAMIDDESDAPFSIVTSSIPTKFSVGDRVKTSSRINVRKTPSTSGTVSGIQVFGALGTISTPAQCDALNCPDYISPTYANGYWWWSVNFDSGADGWVVENYLEKLVVPAPLGRLYIEVDTGGGFMQTSDVIKVDVGQSRRVRAMYQPPMPPCPGGPAGGVCLEIMPVPQEVSAQWTSSNPSIACIITAIPGCNISLDKSIPPLCGASVTMINGVSVGTAEIKALYAPYPNAYTAKATVHVGNVTPVPFITNANGKASADFEMDAGADASIWGSYLAGNTLSSTKVFIGGIQAIVKTASDNYLMITVPSSLLVGQGYDLFVSNEKGVSNVVKIKILSNLTTQPSITVISPNGGESWQMGMSQAIKWRMSSAMQVTAFLADARNASRSWKIQDIYISQAGENAFPWTVGQATPFTSVSGVPPSGSYYVQVCQRLEGQQYENCDYSDAPFSIVTPTPVPIITINDTPLPTGTVGIAYPQPNITASGIGSDAKLSVENINTFQVISALPPGLGITTSPVSCNSAGTCSTNGVIFGTPTAVGTYTFMVTVTSGGKSASKQFQITVNQPSTQPSITVISPNGGEQWVIGKTYDITWRATGTNTVHIDIGKECTVSGTCSAYGIANNIPASAGKFTWRVGDFLAIPLTSGDYRIRVFGDSIQTGNWMEGVNYDRSDAPFSIVNVSINNPPVIRGVPAIPSDIKVNQTVSFSWSAMDADGDNLGWSVDWGGVGGGSGCFAPSTTFTQSHSWSAPGTYTVRATVSDCKGGTDSSSVTVNVGVAAQPSVISLSPTSGPVGTNITITGTGFTSTGNAVNFGSGLIPNLTSPDGKTIIFTLPGILNPACYYSDPRCLMPAFSVSVGAYQVSVKNANGQSNQITFTVTQPSTTSSINVTFPNGGENWVVGSTQTISWSGGSGTTGIYLYREVPDASCGYCNYAMIIASGVSVAQGQYVWTIPVTLATGSAFYIRLSGGSTADNSDAPFSIIAASSGGGGGGGGGGSVNASALSKMANIFGILKNLVIDFLVGDYK